GNLFGFPRPTLPIRAMGWPQGHLLSVSNRQHSLTNDRFIKKLGSDRECEREAASQALRNKGLTVLASLRQVAVVSPNAEMRLRARRLLLEIEIRELQKIMQSKLSNAEECRKLNKILAIGMTLEH